MAGSPAKQGGISHGTARVLTPDVEQLLEAQGIAVVAIIITMPAEKSVARFFVARNRSRVVFMNFETHGPATVALGGILGRRQQQWPEASPPKVGSNCDGIKAGEQRTRWKKYERIAGETFAAVVGDDQRGGRRRQEMAQTSSRQLVGPEDRRLDGDQGGKVAMTAPAQFCLVGCPSGRSGHDGRPCSIRASMLSSSSSRSASTGGLSQRSRLMRGKRIARPDLWRVERCSPSKATSSTRP